MRDMNLRANGAMMLSLFQQKWGHSAYCHIQYGVFISLFEINNPIFRWKNTKIIVICIWWREKTQYSHHNLMWIKFGSAEFQYRTIIPHKNPQWFYEHAQRSPRCSRREIPERTLFLILSLCCHAAWLLFQNTNLPKMNS